MLPDPISLTYNSGAISLARIENTERQTVYMSSDNQFKLVITKSMESDLPGTQTIATLYKRTMDADPFNGQLDHSAFSVIAGVGVNDWRLDESNRSLLKATLDGFMTSYASRLVIGEI